MSEDKFKAVVLRSTPVSDNASLLSVLTDTRGKKLVTCHGAKKLTGRNMPAVQPFCYSEMTVGENKGRLTLREATLIESFFDLRCDLLSSALGAYMLETAAEAAREEEDESELLRLLLNSLYALSKALAPRDLIKAAYELRLLEILGFGGVYECCACCGKEPEKELFYSPAEGGVICPSCAKREGAPAALPFNQSAREALAYILLCPPKKLFSFKLTPDGGRLLARAAEESVLYYFERNFESLKFYNKMRGEMPEI